MAARGGGFPDLPHAGTPLASGWPPRGLALASGRSFFHGHKWLFTPFPPECPGLWATALPLANWPCSLVRIARHHSRWPSGTLSLIVVPPRRAADDPTRREQPEPQGRRRHPLQPAQPSLEEHAEVVAEHRQAQRRLGAPELLQAEIRQSEVRVQLFDHLLAARPLDLYFSRQTETGGCVTGRLVTSAWYK